MPCVNQMNYQLWRQNFLFAITFAELQQWWIFVLYFCCNFYQIKTDAITIQKILHRLQSGWSYIDLLSTPVQSVVTLDFAGISILAYLSQITLNSSCTSTVETVIHLRCALKLLNCLRYSIQLVFYIKFSLILLNTRNTQRQSINRLLYSVQFIHFFSLISSFSLISWSLTRRRHFFTHIHVLTR